MSSEKIPIYGSIKRPLNPEEGMNEVANGKIKWDKGDIKIRFVTDEFTSVCPSTGQPDFNTVKITYIPKGFYIESKTMKFYLWSFREYGIHCEKLAVKIAEDIKNAIDCKYVKVVVIQKPRGGVKLISKAKRGFKCS